MGNFRLEVEGVGAHGCDRQAKEGEAISLPPSPEFSESHVLHCPDCAFRSLVDLLRAQGVFDYGHARATITHWPGTPEEVVDDVFAMRRVKGHFDG